MQRLPAYLQTAKICAFSWNDNRGSFMAWDPIPKVTPGDYRILYEIRDKALIVFVIMVGTPNGAFDVQRFNEGSSSQAEGRFQQSVSF